MGIKEEAGCTKRERTERETSVMESVRSEIIICTFTRCELVAGFPPCANIPNKFPMFILVVLLVRVWFLSLVMSKPHTLVPATIYFTMLCIPGNNQNSYKQQNCENMAFPRVN
jgi:hypothetical protein